MLGNVIKGWYRFLFKKRSALANSRLSVCKDCELRKGVFCSVCGCELHAKASLIEEKCPDPKMNRWIYIDSYYNFINKNKPVTHP